MGRSPVLFTVNLGCLMSMGMETRLHCAEGAQPKPLMERDRAKMRAEPQQSRSIPSLKIIGSFFLLLWHTALCALFCPLPSAAQGQSAIQMMVHDEAGKPARNVKALLKRNGVDVRVAVTNDQGEIVFNTGDPQYRVFFGNYKRLFRGDFDVLFWWASPHAFLGPGVVSVLEFWNCVGSRSARKFCCPHARPDPLAGMGSNRLVFAEWLEICESCGPEGNSQCYREFRCVACTSRAKLSVTSCD